MTNNISFGALPHNLWNKPVLGASNEDIATIVNDAKLQASKLYVNQNKIVDENEPEYFDENKRFTSKAVEALKAQAIYSPTGKIETARELRDALANRAAHEMRACPEDANYILQSIHMF